MSKLPSFRSYGQYASDNYGAHTLVFTDSQGNSFYFSFKTLVAFISNKGLVCSKNYWGVTTAKHLNWIQPDKSKRVDSDTFKKLYDECFPDEPLAQAS